MSPWFLPLLVACQTPQVELRRPDVDTATADTADTGAPPLEVCYQGTARDWATCLVLAEPADPGDDYAYPSPYQGSDNYRPPVAYLDLAALDPSLRLAPNFQLGEVARESSGRYAVVQPHAIDRIQAVRDLLGPLGVNSGYRSPGYNASVPGSATYSRHMYGDAFDLDPIDATLDQLADACEGEGAGYVGVYETHIHCDWRADPVDESFYGSPGRARLASAPLPHHEAEVVEVGGALTAPAVGWDEGEPLREWTAWDASGSVLVESRGDTFEPPPGAAWVEVRVGRLITAGYRP